MNKIIDSSKTIYELAKENNDFIEIMKKLDFEAITEAKMINSAGRIMTLSKGAKMKNINIDIIKNEFEKRGYEFK
ncbi:MAG: DUF1858 domain-containing protein [Clostridiaceae bacterium]